MQTDPLLDGYEKPKTDPLEMDVEDLDSGAGSSSAPQRSGPRTGKRESGKSSARTRTSSAPSRTATKEEKVVKTKFEKELEQFFTGIGFLGRLGCDVCGTHVMTQAPKLAEVYNRLAEKDPRVKQWLQTLMTGGTISETVTVTVVTVFPILAHHGLIGRKRKKRGEHPVMESVDDVLGADDETLQAMVNADGSLT